MKVKSGKRTGCLRLPFANGFACILLTFILRGNHSLRMKTKARGVGWWMAVRKRISDDTQHASCAATAVYLRVYIYREREGEEG